MTYKIEKGVPKPATSGRHGRASRYPFDDMAIGDSFTVKANEEKSLRSAASYYALRTGKKCQVLKDSGGFRCWRVS